MTNEENITKFDEIDVSNIPSLKDGACFHGEIWMVCPYCDNAMEMMGSTYLLKKNGYKLYQCEKCKKIVKDR